MLSKTKDVMFAETYSRIILLPFQKVAIKTHAMSFSRSLPKTALVSCFWAALKENVFSHPSQSVLLHLSWNAVKALSSLIMHTGSHACWNDSVLTFSPPQPRASWRQSKQCSSGACSQRFPSPLEIKHAPESPPLNCTGINKYRTNNVPLLKQHDLWKTTETKTQLPPFTRLPLKPDLKPIFKIWEQMHAQT